MIQGYAVLSDGLGWKLLLGLVMAEAVIGILVWGIYYWIKRNKGIK